MVQYVTYEGGFMPLQEIIEYYRKTEEDLKGIALSLDKNGNTVISLIKKDDSLGKMTIDTYTLEEEKCGFIDVRTSSLVCDENRLYLMQVYCYEKFRSLGITSNMSSLLDYIMKGYNGYVIYGDFNPTQMSTDTIDGKMTKEELIIRAKAFYKKAKYEVLTYAEYMANKSKYPYLDKEVDFGTYHEYMTRVFKKIEPQDEYDYTLVNGILVHKNAIKTLKI